MAFGGDFERLLGLTIRLLPDFVGRQELGSSGVQGDTGGRLDASRNSHCDGVSWYWPKAR